MNFDPHARSPAMRNMARALIVSLLFSTTVAAAGGSQNFTLPASAVNTLAAEQSVDWLAATSLAALADVSTGSQGAPLTLSADVDAEDGQVVTSLRPRLAAPSALSGPSLNYIVATAPTLAGESINMFESGATSARSWQVPVSQLAQGGSYYWKVIDLSQGDSSDWYSFTVDTRRVGVQAVDAVGPLSVGLASGELTTGAGTIGVPTVAGQLRLSLAYSSADHSSNTISEGWSLAGLADLGYVQATYSGANADAITLSTLEGSSLTFAQSAGDDHWQAAPQGDLPAGLAGSLTVTSGGEIVYTAISGAVSVFNSAGNLQSKSVAGQGSAVQWVLNWSANRITRITDPVSGRSALFYYAYPGNYATQSGFDSFPPAGKLTRFINLDGRSSTLFYKDAKLARIEQTGGKVMDFAYDGAGRLAQVRTPAAADADANDGVDSTRRYEISYLSDGRVEAITAPAPLPGADRFSHSYSYGNQQTTVTRGMGSTNTPLKTVVYDSRWRTVSDSDLITNLSTSYEWNGDRMTAVVDGHGLKRTAMFDAYGRLATVYGPAPEGQFAADGTPNDASVPVLSTAYDGGLDNLVVRAWEQSGFAGAPAVIGTSASAFNLAQLDGFNASSNWSAIISTVITAPSSGELSIRATVPNNAAVSVTLLTSGAERIDASSMTVTAVTAGEVIPVTLLLDSSASNSSGTLTLAVSTDTGSSKNWTDLNDSELSPGLGLTTTTSGSEQLSTGASSSTLSTSVTYHDPVLGSPQTQIVDPSGLALSTGLEYGNSYGRLEGQTLPSGMAASFSYWAGGTAACSGAYTTAGNLASISMAHPTQANTTGRTVTTFYNASGLKVGLQVDSDDASCMTYDNRGRVLSIDVPATTEASAKQLSYEYGLSGSQTRVTQTSTVGSQDITAVRITRDLSGRVIESIDEWGTVASTVYDDAGQQVTRTTVITDTYGQSTTTTMVSTFDAAGRISAMTRNGVSMVSSVAYNDSAGSAVITYGNGVSAASTLDAYGHVDQQVLTLANSGQVSDTLTRSPSGRILSENLVAADGSTAQYSYQYDQALRLVDASLSGSHPSLTSGAYQWAYGFGSGSGLNAQTGQDGAVSQETVTHPGGLVETKSFAYNYVDGLTAISSTNGNNDISVSYDSSGYNMATLTLGDGTTLTLGYDQENQLVEADDSAGKSVDYIRSADKRLIAKEIQQDGVTTFFNLYSSDGWVLNSAGVPQSQTLGLPGGVTVSIAADNSMQRWQFSSLQGHTLLTTDGLGAQQGSMTLYSPYGEVLTANPEVVSTAPLTGFDGASGVATEPLAIDIALMGDRTYVPMLHSFTTMDPTFNGGSNPYGYANADPVNLHDPSGNSPTTNIFSKEFWDVENPYMWIFVAGVVIGLVTGGAVGFMAPGFFAIGLGGAIAAGAIVGGVGMFTYGMVTTDGDWGASGKMALYGAAFGGVGAALGFVVGYGAGYGVRVATTPAQVTTWTAPQNSAPGTATPTGHSMGGQMGGPELSMSSAFDLIYF